MSVGACRYLHSVPDADPQLGDAYRASPVTSTTGDVHGESSRPCAVVERQKRVALTLTRTTHPEPDARMLPSPKNEACRFDKDGFWQDRYQRPIHRKYWGTSDFMYVARLPEIEAEQLAEFWKVTLMLGRRNQ